MALQPQQRLASPSRTFSGLFHLTGLLLLSASLYYMSFMLPIKASDPFSGYLTPIGLLLALVTFILGLLADILLSSWIFTAKNTISVCSTTIEALISVLVLGIYAIDRELVIPPDLQLPLLADFALHLMPAIFLLLDLILFSPPWTIAPSNAIVMASALSCSYGAWVEYCSSRNGCYPYPILDLLNTWQRVLLYVVSAALMISSIGVLKWVYGKVNGVEEVKRDAKNPAKVD